MSYKQSDKKWLLMSKSLRLLRISFVLVRSSCKAKKIGVWIYTNLNDLKLNHDKVIGKVNLLV